MIKVSLILGPSWAWCPGAAAYATSLHSMFQFQPVLKGPWTWTGLDTRKREEEKLVIELNKEGLYVHKKLKI